MITTTNNTRKVAVGTVKKSTATRSLVWLRRKVFHVWLERRVFGRYLRRVDSETGIPSLANSSRILMQPQTGLSCHIRRMSFTKSRLIRGRPARGRDLQHQKVRNAVRCHLN
jgi:hypothetical protein